MEQRDVDMDSRFCNKDFNKIVLDCFNEVIKNFNFKVKTGNTWSSVELYNDKCIIEFVYDSGFLCGSFSDPKEKREREKNIRPYGFPNGYPKYQFYPVWKFLYSNDKTDYTYKGMDLTGQVLADKKLILERFVNILNGDFTWTKAYWKKCKHK